MSEIVEKLDNEIKKAEECIHFRKDILPIFFISDEVKRVDIPVCPNWAKATAGE